MSLSTFMQAMDRWKAKLNFIGEVSEIRIKLVKDKKPLKGAKLKDFEQILEVYSSEIVQKWVDYFVYHKDVKFERITNKLK